MIARLRIRVREKATHRTWVVFYPWYPWTNGVCLATGVKQIVYPGCCGYTEYNDCGEPVLDSFVDRKLNGMGYQIQE